MKLAITHQVSHRINECEVNFRDREPIDLALARNQHEGYCDWLRSIGVEVVKVDVNPDHPDSVFVEDTAVVVDELAVMTTMGVASRRGEVAGMEKVLAQYRPIKRIAEMGFDGASLEGGDVLRVGRDFFVGLTTRSNLAGTRALEAALKPFGYSVTPVPVSSGLHLKSAASALDGETLLVHLPALDPEPLKRYRFISVPAEEPRAANVLVVDGNMAIYSGYEKTRALLEREGYAPAPIDISELIKADSGLTCSSIVMNSI